ncbi:PREDICTED: C-type lectin domain family 7 member A-like, partial [Acanthisitta chloris]|uniref:C-type lectin domain family 7 member A-like n=1 Tax=Acanthisitta chloris TaxID=57068 RepID=UPI0004F0F2A1
CTPCSKGWVYFANSCYFFSKKSVNSWASAQRFCSTLGTNLLQVDSNEEKVRGDRDPGAPR